MTRRIAAAALLVACAWTAWAQAERTVWDGVYTAAQSARGQGVFERICAECHNSADFTGSGFLGSWEASTTLDLFRQIQKTMPMDTPGSLSPQEYVDVVAYFLKLNEMPAGSSELASDADSLKAIRIEARKK
jgi:cytochrome c